MTEEKEDDRGRVGYLHWQSRSISLILHDTRRSPYSANLSAPPSQEWDSIPRYKG
jgi:hypothetical protein